MISIMVSHFDYKHRCLIENNVPIAFILPRRWQDGAESLGMEHTSCLSSFIDNKTAVFLIVLFKKQQQSGLVYSAFDFNDNRRNKR